MLRSVGKQSGESVESVLKKKMKSIVPLKLRPYGAIQTCLLLLSYSAQFCGQCVFRHVAR